MWARVSATMVAAGLLVGCAQGDPALEEVLADAVVDDAEAAATVTDGTAADPVSESEDVAEEPVDAGGEGDADVEDPFAVPEVIDEAYVSLVINELLAIVSESVNLVLSGEDATGEDAIRVHEAVFGDPQLNARLEEIRAWVTTPSARQNQLAPDERGVERFEVVSLASVRSECVAAFGHYDLSETAVVPFGPDQYAVFVIHRTSATDLVHNPTSWVLWDAALLREDGQPIPRDRLDEVTNLEALLDVDCRLGS